MIIDLTHTITPEMPMYPGSAAPSIKPTGSLTRDGFRETQLTIASHTGTHLDAPSHMRPRGSTLEVLPASQFCGRAVVLDVSDLPPRSVITADYLREQNGTIRSADFVLFYTGWERKWGTGAYYDDDFPVPDQEAAKYLVSCGLKGVGSPGSPRPHRRGDRRPQRGHPAGSAVPGPQNSAGRRSGDPGEPVPEKGRGAHRPDAFRTAPEI